ncbi:MAG: NnrS family protein [Geminicoccaceae bacterium]|nr:NnrS family protein [Geminicoccaceae bacterium]
MAVQARARPTGRDRPALFSNGFRPFFLGGAAWAVAALALWLAVLSGAVSPFGAFDPLVWHQHEMLFGAIGAIITGFLLTAIPNWTGALPVRGRPLLALFLAWGAARLANLAGGAWVALAVETAFLAALPVMALREIVKGKNWRNLPVCALIGLFALAGLLSHLEAAADLPTGDPGRRLGLGVVLLLIGLVGGRVVPSFTRNWLVKRGVTEKRLPAPFGAFDKLALLALALALLAWVLLPGPIMGPLLVLAGFLHLVRLGRWAGHRTGGEPLVAVLHVGYAWLGAGLVLLGLAEAGLVLERAAAVHALTAGAAGTMTLAVMTRASLGHTGRTLHAGPATVAVYALVCSGALLRVLVPALPGDAVHWLGLSALLWGGAYALFCAVYGPMLVAKKAGPGG